MTEQLTLIDRYGRMHQWPAGDPRNHYEVGVFLADTDRPEKWSILIDSTTPRCDHGRTFCSICEEGAEKTQPAWVDVVDQQIATIRDQRRHLHTPLSTLVDPDTQRALKRLARRTQRAK